MKSRDSRRSVGFQRPSRSAARLLTLIGLPVVFGTGCVERTLTVNSEPQGALVYLNGQEVGRTPMRKNFIYYGTYDVQLRKEGYQLEQAKAKVWSPIWQVPPIDLVAELVPLPLVDRHSISYTLTPLDEQQAGASMTAEQSSELISRGIDMRKQLQGSPNPPAHIAKPGRKPPKS